MYAYLHPLKARIFPCSSVNPGESGQPVAACSSPVQCCQVRYPAMNTMDTMAGCAELDSFAQYCTETSYNNNTSFTDAVYLLPVAAIGITPISNMWPLTFTVVLFVTIGFVHATVQNITIDSTNVTRIQYSGNWATSTPNDFDYGGTHEWSSDPSANAKFTFIGP